MSFAAENLSKACLIGAETRRCVMYGNSSSAGITFVLVLLLLLSLLSSVLLDFLGNTSKTISSADVSLSKYFPSCLDKSFAGGSFLPLTDTTLYESNSMPEAPNPAFSSSIVTCIGLSRPGSLKIFCTTASKYFL